MPVVAWLLSPLLRPVLKYGAIVMAVLGVIFMIRRSGRLAERMEGAERALENAARVRQLESQTRGMSDEQLDDFLLSPNRRKSKRR